MRRTVGPARIDGVLRAPPSKSVMLRVTAAALLAAERTTTILNPSHCGDALSGLRVAEARHGAAMGLASVGVVAVRHLAHQVDPGAGRREHVSQRGVQLTAAAHDDVLTVERQLAPGRLPAHHHRK